MDSYSFEVMTTESFERVLRGFSPEAVTARIGALEAERAYLKTQLAEAQEANTDLRLSMVKQVEEASAEAAVVLGHGRGEALRIREKAIAESETLLDDARRNAKDIETEAQSAREEAQSLRDKAKLEADDIRSKAEEDALSILNSARSRASHLEEEAASVLQEATKRSEQLESELRLQKQDLDRHESDVRDQADSYSLRVHREADAYARASEKRALDTEKQAEEILADAKRTAFDITSRATTNARKNLEESLRLVNLIFSDVSGSLAEVTRIRSVLGDEVQRLAVKEAPTPSITDVQNPPSPVDLDEELPEDDQS
jgi:cell division septum initiation protein DivIVA